MPVNISPTQAIIERSIQSAIRRVLIDQGLSLDRSNYDLISEGGQQSYNNDMQTIALSKGYSVEVFNHSSAQFKGLKQIARVSIDPYGFMPGNTGNDPTPFFKKNEDGSFTKSILPSKFSDYEVNIYITGNTADQIRVLGGVISFAMGKRGWLPRYPEITRKKSGNLFYEQMDTYDDSDIAEGVIEKVFRYQFKDVFEIAEQDDPDVVAAIREIDLDLVVEKILSTTTITDTSGFDTIEDNGGPYDLVILDN